MGVGTLQRHQGMQVKVHSNGTSARHARTVHSHQQSSQLHTLIDLSRRFRNQPGFITSFWGAADSFTRTRDEGTFNNDAVLSV